MTSIPSYWLQAVAELSARDPVMRSITSHPDVLSARARGDAFSTLARAIVGQQISVKAAASIWNKLVAAVPKIHANVIHMHDSDALRSCGLSRSKVVYLQDLARHFVEKRLNTRRWKSMSDDDLIADLVQVKGIGRWTAEMFSIFYLARPNVLPLDDIGVQRAIELHYNRGRKLTRKKMQALARKWEPWSTVATWYLWRSLESAPIAKT